MPGIPYIFDTSPLITLAGANLDDMTALEHFLSLIDITIVETVAQEATANLIYPDALIVKKLLDTRQILPIPVPITPVDHLINAYPKLGTGKGKGERDTIRLGITTPGWRVIMDDQQAYFVAARFELTPLTLLDLIVDLTRTQMLNKPLSFKIVQAVSRRYTSVAIQHTMYKLNEVQG
jgi:hypothetical protein